MKSNRMLAVAMLGAGTIGASVAMAKALERDADDRRYALDADKRKAEDAAAVRYGPGTGKIPADFPMPTQRDKDRMAQAEEKRARRQARNLRTSNV